MKKENEQFRQMKKEYKRYEQGKAKPHMLETKESRGLIKLRISIKN
jgi:hypothetical protein